MDAIEVLVMMLILFLGALIPILLCWLVQALTGIPLSPDVYGGWAFVGLAVAALPAAAFAASC